METTAGTSARVGKPDELLKAQCRQLNTKNSRGPNHNGTNCEEICEIYLQLNQISIVKYQRKIPSCFWKAEGE